LITAPVGSVSLGGLLVSFSYLSMTNHIVSVIRRKAYEGMLEQRRNLHRWVEYSISAGIMLFVIAALSGLTQIYDFIWLVALTLSTMTAGYATEVTAGRMIFFWAGSIINVLAWGPILTAFIASVIQSSDTPAAVVAVAPTLFVLFSCFALVQLYQFTRFFETLFGCLLAPCIPCVRRKNKARGAGELKQRQQHQQAEEDVEGGGDSKKGNDDIEDHDIDNNHHDNTSSGDCDSLVVAQARYLHGEIAYIVLSLVAKTILAGLVYGGVIARKDSDVVASFS